MPASEFLHSYRLLRSRARRVLAAMTTSYGRRGLRFGVVPGVSAQHMLRRIRPSYVVDVGANRGQFALDVITAVPTASIMSFEPINAEADIFEQVLGDHEAVELHRCAVGSADTVGTLHLTQASDSSSMLAPNELQCLTFPRTDEVGTMRVNIRTLRTALPARRLPPDSLLKADVQGYELEVLRGAGDRLREFNWLYTEVSFVELYASQPLADKVIIFASEHGFRLADMTVPTRRGGHAIQVDLLFERVDAVNEAPVHTSA